MNVENDRLYVEEDEVGEDEQQDEGEEVFSCKYCDFQTINVDYLDEHIVDHDEAILEDEMGFMSQEQDEATAVVSSPSNESSVKYSIKAAKQRLPAYFDEYADKANKKVLVCAYCGYQTMKKKDLNMHVNNHSDPVELPVYSCAECAYTTRRKCDMPKHLLTHCDVGTVPMHNCQKCSYTTKRKGDLSKHMLLHTEVTTLFKCSECEYSSKRQGDLKKHLLCHEQQPPKELFHCSECGYTSKRLNDLHKHAVLHCDRTVKGAFKCVKCDYASFAGNAFAKHLLSKCKINNQQVTLFAKDGSTQEYVLVEETDGNLYSRNKGQVSYEAKMSGKRMAMGDYQHDAKRTKTPQFVRYKNAIVETTKEPRSNKVVILAGFEDGVQDT